MDKYEHSQLELFSQLKDNKTDQAAPSNPFLSFIWDYEKIILLIIGFVITAVVAFSFGVAKGKRYSGLNLTSPEQISQTAAERQTPAFSQPQPRVINAQPEKSMVKAAPVPQSTAVFTPQTAVPAIASTAATRGAYTIQVATFKSKTMAKKVADTFRKKGYKVTTNTTKKGYSIVYIGGFSKKEKAQTVLTEIKKQYTDSFIRRL